LEQPVIMHVATLLGCTLLYVLCGICGLAASQEDHGLATAARRGLLVSRLAPSDLRASDAASVAAIFVREHVQSETNPPEFISGSIHAGPLKAVELRPVYAHLLRRTAGLVRWAAAEASHGPMDAVVMDNVLQMVSRDGLLALRLPDPGPDPAGSATAAEPIPAPALPPGVWSPEQRAVAMAYLRPKPEDRSQMSYGQAVAEGKALVLITVTGAVPRPEPLQIRMTTIDPPAGAGTWTTDPTTQESTFVPAKSLRLFHPFHVFPARELVEPPTAPPQPRVYDLPAGSADAQAVLVPWGRYLVEVRRGAHEEPRWDTLIVPAGSVCGIAIDTDQLPRAVRYGDLPQDQRIRRGADGTLDWSALVTHRTDAAFRITILDSAAAWPGGAPADADWLADPALRRRACLRIGLATTTHREADLLAMIPPELRAASGSYLLLIEPFSMVQAPWQAQEQAAYQNIAWTALGTDGL
jgi:hypothetical protein